MLKAKKSEQTLLKEKVMKDVLKEPFKQFKCEIPESYYYRLVDHITAINKKQKKRYTKRQWLMEQIDSI